MAEELNGLIQLWSRDDVYVLENGKTLDTSMGIGCFIGGLGTPTIYDQINCFNDETGEIAWQENKSANGGLLASTPNGVLVADYGQSLWNHLTKYDLRSGDLIWRQYFLDTNPTHLVFFNNQIQLITYKPGDNLWLLDTDGNILKKITRSDVFLITSDVTFTDETGIRARRTDTNEIIWEYTDMGRLPFNPVVTQDKIFVRSDIHLGIAYALNRKTGRLLWQVRDIVSNSNLALSPEKHRVYALRKDGDLLAIDENTGVIKVVARFSSPLFLANINRIEQTYELAYDQEQHILLVSLGDGHQLLAFREQ